MALPTSTLPPELAGLMPGAGAAQGTDGSIGQGAPAALTGRFTPTEMQLPVRFLPVSGSEVLGLLSIESENLGDWNRTLTRLAEGQRAAARHAPLSPDGATRLLVGRRAAAIEWLGQPPSPNIQGMLEARGAALLRGALATTSDADGIPPATPQAEAGASLETLSAQHATGPSATRAALDSLLRAAGLTPSGATREAAGALVAEGQPVRRESVQALLALVAGHAGGDRGGRLAAGARLMALDAPVTPPLAAGMAARMAGEGGPALNLLQAREALQAFLAAAPEAVAVEASQALAALEQATVRLGEARSPAELQSFLRGFAREPLGEALRALESTTRMHLDSQAALRNLDRALHVILERLAGGVRLPGPNSATGSATGLQAQAGGSLASPPTLSLPGINPWATLEGWARSAAGGASPGGGAAGGEATPEAWVRSLLEAEDGDAAEAWARRLVQQADRETLQRVADRLETTERDLMRQDDQVQRLQDAAGELRELGRRFLATKAENLASLRNEPSVFLAEVPFQFDDQREDGRLQVFVRRGRREGQERSRVVLDLNTTALGPVVSDLRFLPEALDLTIHVDSPESAAHLEAGLGELRDALSELGFPANPKVRLLPPSTADATPDVDAPRRPLSGRTDRGRIDTKA